VPVFRVFSDKLFWLLLRLTGDLSEPDTGMQVQRILRGAVVCLTMVTLLIAIVDEVWPGLRATAVQLMIAWCR
jgi:hypothetical protein